MLKKKNIKNLFFLMGLIALIMSSNISAQLTKLEGPNLITEADVYKDSNGKKYSTLVTIKFNNEVIKLKKGETKAKIKEIKENKIVNYLEKLEKNYGSFEMIKKYPDAEWGDVLRINKRTKKQVIVPEVSQVYQLVFSELFPIDDIISDLKSQDFIEYVDPPMEAHTCLTVNDPYYTNGSQWSMERVNAENAWDISTGSSAITISINDVFYHPDYDEMPRVHDDISSRVVYHSYYVGYHGNSVAGVAGAVTNNSSGVASLDRASNIRYDYAGTYGLRNAVDNGADIINLSWFTSIGLADLREEIIHALLQGVILVAGSGNDAANIGGNPPLVKYPAAFNFQADTGSVIAVTATQFDGYNETFMDGWNYSVGTDPINDPTNSFVDLTAPGVDIPIFDYSDPTGYSLTGRGTSLAAPLVSSLVGLMLSVDNTLTPVEVYDILTSTADKIGQYTYDTNGWNRYTGYGRINAHNAVNVATGAPAKPRNLHYTNVSNHPNLIWDANTEADLSGYQIYRSYDGSAFSLRATVGSGTTNFTDTQVDFTKPIWAKEVLYKIRAYNTSTQYSIYSDELETEGIIDLAKKNTVENIKTEFSLDQNFPNPFNPTTIINYNLPQNGFVTLKVYDVLGKEIANLVNETKEAGSYSVEFNASNLPSGVYFYKITAGNFSEIKKMILTK